jgi:alkylation response protein AidB-like acyl-CoA dehydrogenase
VTASDGDHRLACPPNVAATDLHEAVLKWIHDNVPSDWLALALGGNLDELRAVRSPDMYRSWYPLLGRSGLVASSWPAEFGGLGFSETLAGVVDSELQRAQLVKLNPLGLGLAGPTLLQWGTESQKARFLRRIQTSEDVWCQLFSEPGAGSDLAALSTRAVPDGSDWIISGQKVWSSMAHEAAFGLLLARTDPDVVKQRGITYFILDLKLPGVTVRPLRKITGDTEFNEVFLDEVRISDEMRVGNLGEGWAVARSTLSHERRRLAGGGLGVRDRVSGRSVERLLTLAATPDEFGVMAASDPVLRSELARIWVESQAIRWTNARIRDARSANGSVAPEASILKLLQSEHNQRLQALAMKVIGLRGAARAMDDLETRSIAYGYLRSRGDTIAGGTSEIQRNLVGERVLGLPREPSQFDDVAWRDLPRGGPVKS